MPPADLRLPHVLEERREERALVSGVDDLQRGDGRASRGARVRDADVCVYGQPTTRTSLYCILVYICIHIY